MQRDLREHFELAVSDDPGVPPGEMARAAISDGGRMRRRRHQLAAAGMVAVVGAVAGLGLATADRASEPPVTIAAAMAPVSAPSCTERPVESDATDVMIFLDSGHRQVLQNALEADARVDALSFESREQAYEKFRSRWAHEPDLIAAVSADRFPEAFRLRLVSPAQYTAFRADFATADGVEQIIGRRCTPDAPVGGVL
ncbi:permease-like cell division protein FtsX [Actinoplanes sp. NBC_00393]|uniref:permease-like cell division protein FtsX n=1 Tax=Actinoplanes sp. NBC_00393 TaxID=2975953 RepID=UPI002E1ED305